MKKLFRIIKAWFTKDIEIPPQPPRVPVNDNYSPRPVFESDLLTNEAGLELIKESEGFYSEPYRCPAGVPTIGYGTIKYPGGKKVKLSNPACTKLQAIDWLKYEVDQKENVIYNFLEVNRIDLNTNQFSALVSFAYNLGNGPIITDGKTMNRALLTGDEQDVASAFMIYNKARVGVFRRLKVLRGLTIRRRKERDLYLKVEES